MHRSATDQADIWLLELRSSLVSRFTLTRDRFEVTPIWSPDGSSVVFMSRGKGAADLYQKAVAGAGTEEPLLVSDQDKSPTDWSADGKFVLFQNTNPQTSTDRFADIWAMPMGGDRKPFPVVQTAYREQNGQFSPDGKWIAYESNESGQFEVYVQPFPGPGDKWRVSTTGGAQVRWRRDGKEIFYIGLDTRLMAVPIQLDSDRQAVDAGTPVPLFTTRVGPAVQGPINTQYIVSPDGQRFLMNTVAGKAATPPITVILNWKPGS
jgi:Tol biopolymer transport system component